MKIAYKFRSTILNDNGVPRDVKSILEYKLFASNVTTFNDVFEMGYDDRPVYNLLNNIDKLKLVDINEVKIRYEELKKHIKDVGVYSLFICDTNIPDNVLMWSLYADSHKGFCIAYDLEQLQKSEEYAFNVNVAQVNYTETYPILTLDKFRDKDEAIKIIIGSKSIDWKYENEVRLIYEQQGEHLFNKHAIKAIYFGLRMDKKYCTQIIEGLAGIDVDFYQMERIQYSYQLTAKLIHKNYRIDKDKRLDVTTYKIMRHELRNTVENFDVLYKDCDKSEETIKNFVKLFRQQYTSKALNINLFDDIMVEPLLNIYPLDEKEEVIFNNHWIAMVNAGIDTVLMWPGKC